MTEQLQTFAIYVGLNGLILLWLMMEVGLVRGRVKVLIGDGGNGFVTQNAYDGSRVYAEGGNDEIWGGDGVDTIVGDNYAVGSLIGDLIGGNDEIHGGVGGGTLIGDTRYVATADGDVVAGEAANNCPSGNPFS